MSLDPPDDSERDWVQHMADLEEKHGGFPGVTGGVAMARRIRFPLNGVECYLTFADSAHGTPQGWAKPEYLTAAGYVLASEAKADKLQALRDIAFRLRQHTAALFMDSDEDGDSFRSLLIEIDAEIAKG